MGGREKRDLSCMTPQPICKQIPMRDKQQGREDRRYSAVVKGFARQSAKKPQRMAERRSPQNASRRIITPPMKGKKRKKQREGSGTLRSRLRISKEGHVKLHGKKAHAGE